jgi:hypothetical protein
VAGLQAADGVAQRAPADAVGGRQFRLADLAAAGDLALHDGLAQAAEDPLGEGDALFVRMHDGAYIVNNIVPPVKNSPIQGLTWTYVTGLPGQRRDHRRSAGTENPTHARSPL